MLKKLFCLSCLMFCFSSLSFAGSFYFGPALTYQHSTADNYSFEGISPLLFGGYGTWLDNFYIAAEAFVAAKAIELGNDDDDTLRTGVTYGLSILPSINLDNTLLAFVRLGYLRAKFTHLDTQEGAYQLGLGAETSLFTCWKVRLEYNYVPFRSVETVGTIQGNFVTLSFVYRMDSATDTSFD